MSHSDTVFVFILTVLGGIGFGVAMFGVGCSVGRREGRKERE